MKPYSTTAQVLNQAIANLAGAKGSNWNVSEPGTVVIQDITYSALSTGGAGPVTVQYVGGGTAGSEVVTVTGQAIVVKIQSAVSTATQVLAKINASAAAIALVYASITGTAGTAQIATTAPTTITGDICLRINEADNAIDTRLAGMGVTLPFTTNPPLLQDLSVLYARYACLRDLYTGANPAANSESAKMFLAQFDSKWEQIRSGFVLLVDTSNNPITGSKYTPGTVDYPVSQPVTDNYPLYPLGPYPDLPGTEY